MPDPTAIEQERALEVLDCLVGAVADCTCDCTDDALQAVGDAGGVRVLLDAALAEQRERYDPLVAVVETHLAYHESVAETVPDKETSSGFIEQAKAALDAIRRSDG